VLAAGLLSTLLLFGVLYSLSSSPRSAPVALAARMTKDLRESEERLPADRRERVRPESPVMDPQGQACVRESGLSGSCSGTCKRWSGSMRRLSIHPEDRDRVRREFSRDDQGRPSPVRASSRFLLPNSEVRDIESSRSAVLDPQGRVEYVVGGGAGRHERRRTGRPWRARDLQLQEAQVLANLGSWEWDLRTNTRTWSEQLVADLGSGRTIGPRLRPASIRWSSRGSGAADDAGARSAAHRQEYESQFRHRASDGAVGRCKARRRVDLDDTGRLVRVIGVCQDVTERRSLKSRCESRRKRFRMMVENVRDYAI